MSQGEVPLDWQKYDNYQDLYSCKECGYVNGMSGSRNACDSCPAGPYNASVARDKSQKACGYRVTCIHPVCPSCGYQTFMVEADSVKEARNQSQSKIPVGFALFSVKVLSDGSPQIVRMAAETLEAASTAAQKKLPPDAEIVEKKEVYLPGQQNIVIEAFDEKDATKQIEDRSATTLGPIRLVDLGKKGFLGIGRKPNQYEVEVSQQAVVEIIYKMKALISVTARKKS